MTADPPPMNYVFHLDEKSISPAQMIMVSKIANIWTAILRLEAAFADTIRSLLR